MLFLNEMVLVVVVVVVVMMMCVEMEKTGITITADFLRESE